MLIGGFQKTGGFQKNSFIDFPGKISAVIFFSGCNFKCPYCHNPELAMGKTVDAEHYDKNKILDFLSNRKKFLDGVVLSGGEPTLQKNLFSFCSNIKQMGFPVKLDTNGSRPDVIKKLIENNLIDYIAMDVKTDPFNYSPIIQEKSDPEELIKSINIIINSDIKHEFRTTCVKPFINMEIIENISKLIKGADLYVIQQFNNKKVLDPKFFNNKDYIIKDSELKKFKNIAQTRVKKCIIRENR